MRHTVWDLSFWKRHVCAHCIHTTCFFFRHFTLCIQTRVAAHIQCTEAKLCSLSHQSANGYCKESKHNQRRMSGRERLKKEEEKKNTRGWTISIEFERIPNEPAQSQLTQLLAFDTEFQISRCIILYTENNRSWDIFLDGKIINISFFLLVLHFALPNMFCVVISSTANHSA